MNFSDLIKLMEDEFGIDVQADIARELDVTPQTLNNWKVRNRVPFKYVKKINKRIKKKQINQFPNSAPLFYSSPNISEDDNSDSIFNYIILLIIDIKKNAFIFIFFIMLFLCGGLIKHKFYSTPLYMSTATIFPTQESSNLSNTIGNLSKSFGMNVGGNNISLNSLEMIPQIITSKSFALKILNREFNSSVHGKSKKLINILSYKNDLSANKLSTRDTVSFISSFISKNIKILRSDGPNTIKFGTYFYEPDLAKILAESIIDELNSFFKENKKSKNFSKKLFINDRSSQVFAELTKKENKLKEFREKNRNISSSPELLLEQTRMIRDVEVQSQLYITLLSQYELVSIDESEDIDFLEILNPPFAPTSRIAPILTNTLVTFLILGVLFGVIIVYIYNGKLINYYKYLLKEFY